MEGGRPREEALPEARSQRRMMRQTTRGPLRAQCDRQRRLHLALEPLAKEEARGSAAGEAPQARADGHGPAAPGTGAAPHRAPDGALDPRGTIERGASRTPAPVRTGQSGTAPGRASAGCARGFDRAAVALHNPLEGPLLAASTAELVEASRGRCEPPRHRAVRIATLTRKRFDEAHPLGVLLKGALEMEEVGALGRCHAQGSMIASRMGRGRGKRMNEARAAKRSRRWDKTSQHPMAVRVRCFHLHARRCDPLQTSKTWAARIRSA